MFANNENTRATPSSCLSCFGGAVALLTMDSSTSLVCCNIQEVAGHPQIKETNWTHFANNGGVVVGFSACHLKCA